MVVKETRKCPGLVIYFKNTLQLQQLKLGSWAGWKNYNRYKHARSRENTHRLYKSNCEISWDENRLCI